MSEDISYERRKKISVVKYASNVFKKSSVSAVTGILTTGNIKRKVFKSAIFLIFTIAFLYQVITFLSYVLEYPTVVNIDIIKPDEYMAPAFTLCNSQKMRRSKYCEKYPDRCASTDDDFCKKYSKYCKLTDIKVNREFYNRTSLEDLFQFGHSLHEMIEPHRGTLPFSEEPVLRLRYFFDAYHFSICVTTKSLVNSQEEPLMIKRRDYFHQKFDKSLQLYLNSHDADMFDPDISPGIYFSVHSPYDAENPFLNGYFLIPGMQYKIKIQMKEEKLLPPPYKTNCMDYVELWKKTGKTGPRSQEMCRQKCVVDHISRCYNCYLPILTYPSESKNICSKEVDEGKIRPKCIEVNKDNIEKCVDACKPECLKTVYSMDVRPMHLPYYKLYQETQEANNFSSRSSRQIILDLEFDDSEVLRYEFSPKYQDVEAFSYIGGFIGIWLGISLVQITDFMESIFLIGRYLFKKSSCSCKI